MKKKKKVRSQESGVRRGIFLKSFWLLASGFWLLLFSACSSGGDESSTTTTTSQPIVITARPSSAKIGATVTLQGVGFSQTFNQNIVIVGNVTTQALSHQFIPTTPSGATEEITFVIPNNAQVGTGTIMTIVEDVFSNSIPFTVESP